MNLFGKRPSGGAAAKSAPSSSSSNGSPAQSLAKMRTTLSTIEKREAFVQKKMMAQLKDAKTRNSKGDKRGAMFALKKKKMYEKEVEKLGNTRMTIESQILALENASVTLDVVGAMRAGASTQKKLQAKMNVESVEDLQDEIAESMQLAEEVSEAISQPVGDLYDDDELLGELDELETEELAENMDFSELDGLPDSEGVENDDLKALAALEKSSNAMPSAPTTSVDLPADVDEDEEAALNRLAAEMAL